MRPGCEESDSDKPDGFFCIRLQLPAEKLSCRRVSAGFPADSRKSPATCFQQLGLWLSWTWIVVLYCKSISACSFTYSSRSPSSSWHDETTMKFMFAAVLTLFSEVSRQGPWDSLIGVICVVICDAGRSKTLGQGAEWRVWFFIEIIQISWRLFVAFSRWVLSSDS